MSRLGILGSTRGTNLLGLIEAITHKQLLASIEIVISNQPDAGILQHASRHNLVAEFIDPTGLQREEFDKQISAKLREKKVDLILLTGYMRILSNAFVQEWRNKLINVHPSLLPKHAGGMDANVHRAVLDAGDTESGCTVHFVTEELDGGPIIVQKKCAVLPNDSVETLKARVQSLENLALIETIHRIMEVS